jgi:hypothetical protein
MVRLTLSSRHTTASNTLAISLYSNRKVVSDEMPKPKTRALITEKASNASGVLARREKRQGSSVSAKAELRRRRTSVVFAFVVVGGTVGMGCSCGDE